MRGDGPGLGGLAEPKDMPLWFRELNNVLYALFVIDLYKKTFLMDSFLFAVVQRRGRCVIQICWTI